MCCCRRSDRRLAIIGVQTAGKNSLEVARVEFEGVFGPAALYFGSFSAAAIEVLVQPAAQTVMARATAFCKKSAPARTNRTRRLPL